jgi:hypothetical protein
LFDEEKLAEMTQRAVEAKAARAHAARIEELQAGTAWHLGIRPEQDLTVGEKILLESKLAELRSVNTEIAAFQKKNPMAAGKEPPREYMVLKNRQARLQREIESVTKAGAGATRAAPSAVAPAAQTAPKRLRWTGTGFEEIP